MNNEDKLKKINAACDLIYKAMQDITIAREKMAECGISMEMGLYSHREMLNTAYGDPNVMLHSGVKRLEEITRVSSKHPMNCMAQRDDESRMVLIYRGVKFGQKGKPNGYKFD